MILIISIFIQVLIVGLFLYSKLLPYELRLNGNYAKGFTFFKKIFTPIFTGLKKFFPPVEVGQGLSVDMTQIVLLIMLLVLNNIF
jgi:hypothetical protein